MKRINREEYEELKELDDKWKWIARDSNTSLWAYKTKPRRFGGSFGLEDPAVGDCHYILGDQFNFVRWEDEKPYSIAELVEEYEKAKILDYKLEACRRRILFKGFCLCNILKYIIRAEKKNGIEDYRKAKQYLEWLIELEEE